MIVLADVYETGNVTQPCNDFPHCLRAQYQPVVICAIFAYCLWVAGVLRPKDYVTFNAVNSGISSPCVPLNTAVNNYPCKKRVKRNCWYDYLTIRITVICSNSPLFTISKEGDESAKNVDIINYF